MKNEKVRTFALWLSVAASMTALIGFYWQWNDRKRNTTTTAANTD
jgi:hypothetical protein